MSIRKGSVYTLLISLIILGYDSLYQIFLEGFDPEYRQLLVELEKETNCVGKREIPIADSETK